MTFRSAILAVSVMTLIGVGGGAVAAASKVSKVCEADFHKLCPTATAGRGAVMRCVKTQLAAVTPDCKSAVETAQATRAAHKAARAAAKAAAAKTGTTAPG